MNISRAISSTMATPRKVPILVIGAMLRVVGLGDDCTRSVARAILAKSVMKISNNMAKAETRKLPVSKNETTTKVALRIVREILLSTQI